MRKRRNQGAARLIVSIDWKYTNNELDELIGNPQSPVIDGVDAVRTNKEMSYENDPRWLGLCHADGRTGFCPAVQKRSIAGRSDSSKAPEATRR
jgi:hypothetical protein